jgi:hypothetical protein
MIHWRRLRFRSRYPPDDELVEAELATPQGLRLRRSLDRSRTERPACVRTAPDKLSLTIDGNRSDVAETIAPASLWSKDIVNRLDLFQADNGKRLSIKVKNVGEEPLLVGGVKRQTRHYRISDKTPGEFDRDVWYEGDILVRMKLLGPVNSTIISDLH